MIRTAEGAKETKEHTENRKREAAQTAGQATRVMESFYSDVIFWK